MIVQCSRCEATSPNTSEFNTELWFNDHECEGLPKLDTLPLQLLREVALGNITEEEAFNAAKEDHS